jgi:hypothetical protein
LFEKAEENKSALKDFEKFIDDFGRNSITLLEDSISALTKKINLTADIEHKSFFKVNVKRLKMIWIKLALIIIRWRVSLGGLKFISKMGNC